MHAMKRLIRSYGCANFVKLTYGQQATPTDQTYTTGCQGATPTNHTPLMKYSQETMLHCPVTVTQTA